ncbi:MAG: 16S rRNA (cytosine(1402)-N(4))-methyltransferase RsmH [Betaproteobacteria bacterium]|nr:16S rRNA (cytosine(1402)-N(4))-methyltransferase RsmH [Betaproteobacteria bacterium]
MTELESHAPVMVEEAVAGLNVQEDGVYVDATFGRGGHARAILLRLGTGGRLLALDRDPEAVAAAAAIADPRFAIQHAPFSALGKVLEAEGGIRIDGLLLDLGVSSPQLDNAARGFSFRQDGPLDMRMDTTRGPTAAEWLNVAEEREIAEVIDAYGEERFAKRIARAIVAARAEQPFKTTRQLGVLVAKAVGTREPGQDPATRTFQALRIHVNQELAELEQVLPQAIASLKPGGRVAVISFHSLEDRIVKRFFLAAERPGAHPALARMPLRERDLPQPLLWRVGRAIKAGAAEVARNPRSRSAVLRIAERTETAA